MVFKLRSFTIFVVLLFMISIVSGCGSPNVTNPQTTAATTQAQIESTTDATTAAAVTTIASQTSMEATIEAGALYKYDPPIAATFGKPLDVNSDGIVAMEKDGEPYDNNRWIKYFRDDVGVECSYKLIAPNSMEYDQKLLLGMSSDDLPDIFWVSSLSMLKQLADAGAIVDMTDYYDQYANETFRGVIEFEGLEIFNPVTFNNRRYAIPVKMPSTNGYNHCWVRQDWLDELGLERPKTMDDVKDITRAFKEHYPDNIGMMINMEYISESKGIFWAFGGQTAVRKYWTTLDDGTVVFSEIQPEMKGGLAWLRDMYAEGLVNQEFATQDIAKAFEYVADNKCGIFFAPHWYGFRLHGAEQSLDPEADFVAVGLPVGSVQTTRVYATNTFDAVECVRAGYEHPEALIHLYNAYEEKLFGPNNDFDNYFSSEFNTGTWSCGPIHALHPMVDLIPHRDIKAALANNTLDELTGAGKSFWKYITTGQRAYDYMFGPVDSCFNFVDDTYPDIIVWNGYMGAPTETWADRWSSLQELIDTTFLKIIQGNLDLDSGFDNMVKEWNALGGEQVTKEVNEIVATYK